MHDKGQSPQQISANFVILVQCPLLGTLSGATALQTGHTELLQLSHNKSIFSSLMGHSKNNEATEKYWLLLSSCLTY